ncbi:hypothetical protein QMK19_30755 [Streptomyces sp. H10-C2]|uniref:hypothetical protein n=1 Tax=unclassified Streptomyces TaxID=2593676 RepID=UPI0024BB854C|nr:MULTISPECIES: hypothetical protein [unclassified Streptomyces]MDJ0345005.1 hypothetical protein [Streptomyces sp. PH10-H1]MDJ0373914.1 hypothetical protein [Streptomyces sp. H10-C2]
MAGEAGEGVARTRALAVLRIRSTALAVALLPAAAAIVLLVGGATGRIGDSWDALRWSVVGGALVVLLLAGAVAAVIVRARPAVSPTVPVAESAAPDLYRMVRDLAVRLQVPTPSAIELTPDCDSWLEDRRPDGGRSGGRGRRREPAAPVLVIGSPFMWWMRVAELRALLAPVVAGTGPSADPDIAAARRFLRGLDAAAGVASAPGSRGLARPAYAFLGWVARLLLRGCRAHAAEMERGVAASASERAQAVDYGLRIVAQEQVGLAYAGWDRLLTRVALPAWRMGRWPSRLDAGVVAALTDLSRRDRLAEGFESRLGERPACDLLEEPGTVDEAASLLAARLFHGGPEHHGPDWSPVDWNSYPEEVVDRIWRSEAALLIRVLDEPGSAVPRPERDRPPVITVEPADHHTTDSRSGTGLLMGGKAARQAAAQAAELPDEPGRATIARVIDRLSQGGSEELAARITGHVAREEAARAANRSPAAGTSLAPVYQLLPPRTGRELLTEHVTAMVCCAAVDTAGATAGLDWLDGPALLVNGARRADLAWPVLRLVENGDAAPLRSWLTAVGVRLEKPVRLV